MARRIRRRTPVPKATQLAREVGARIRVLRIERGLSQQELGGARLTRAAISSLERSVTSPNVHMLAYLAKRLRVKPRDLFPPD